MDYSEKHTHPALLALLSRGIGYDEFLEPILLASCFQLELTQGSPSWTVQTYLSRSVIYHLNVCLLEIIWDEVGCHFTVIKHHPKMLQIIGAVLRVINEVSNR